MDDETVKPCPTCGAPIQPLSGGPFVYMSCPPKQEATIRRLMSEGYFITGMVGPERVSMKFAK